MKEEYYKWYSQSLSKEVEMLMIGEKGIPIILFPTSMGRYTENKDFKLTDAAGWYVEQGLVKFYCIESVDALSWYNKNVPPNVRAYNHTCYDKMLHEELVPHAKAETGFGKIGVAGCSFGGYHAANYAFRHPENVSHIFSMGGAFDIRNQLDGYYDDNVYFNNPPDYLPGSESPDLWKMKIILGTTEGDMCKASNLQLSHILKGKGIKHWLDVRPFGDHDWPIWREMFPHYLSML